MTWHVCLRKRISAWFHRRFNFFHIKRTITSPRLNNMATEFGESLSYGKCLWMTLERNSKQTFWGWIDRRTWHILGIMWVRFYVLWRSRIELNLSICFKHNIIYVHVYPPRGWQMTSSKWFNIQCFSEAFLKTTFFL